MEKYKTMTREDFMSFFRDDKCLNTLSVDDRIEVFRTILAGSSDFTKELLDEILTDYYVPNLEIIDHGKKEKMDKRGNNYCF